MTSNRERFENWYLAEFWEGSEAGREYLAKEPCGGYTHAKPQELWEVWQAAQPAAGEPVAWQWRSRIKGGEWDAWENGRYNSEPPPFMDVEHRVVPPAAALVHRTERKTGV